MDTPTLSAPTPTFNDKALIETAVTSGNFKPVFDLLENDMPNGRMALLATAIIETVQDATIRGDIGVIRQTLEGDLRFHPALGTAARIGFNEGAMRVLRGELEMADRTGSLPAFTKLTALPPPLSTHAQDLYRLANPHFTLAALTGSGRQAYAARAANAALHRQAYGD